MTKSVLVVEDDEVIREMLREILELEAFQVSTAMNGSEALESFAATRPGLVLLDLMMPVMDGFAFIAELERRGVRQEVAVVALSADPALKLKAERLGVESFLGKPVDIEVVLAEIDRLMAARRVELSPYEMSAGGKGSEELRAPGAWSQARREVAAVLEQAATELCRVVSERPADSRPLTILPEVEGEEIPFEVYRPISAETGRGAREVRQQVAEARCKAEESRRMAEGLRQRAAVCRGVPRPVARAHARATTKRYVVRKL